MMSTCLRNANKTMYYYNCSDFLSTTIMIKLKQLLQSIRGL